jgi:hypothetical protein
MQMAVIHPRDYSVCHCFVPSLLLYGESNDLRYTLSFSRIVKSRDEPHYLVSSLDFSQCSIQHSLHWLINRLNVPWLGNLSLHWSHFLTARNVRCSFSHQKAHILSSSANFHLSNLSRGILERIRFVCVTMI